MKKQEQNTKETVSMLVYGYLVILFAGLPLYMQNKLVMIGNAKYLFFRNTTLVLGAFVVLAVLWQRNPGRTDNETDVEENGCVYAVVSGVCNLFLWNQSLQGGCPFRVSRLVYGAGDPGIAGGDLFCGIPVL
ncbi:MAG: hypothetical protein V8Q05_05030 [Lachnospiraceae bacterium]